jgi:hypothetical protein
MGADESKRHLSRSTVVFMRLFSVSKSPFYQPERRHTFHNAALVLITSIMCATVRVLLK